MRMTLNWVPTIPPGGGRNRLAVKSWAKFAGSFWASGKVIEAWFGGQKARNRKISCAKFYFIDLTRSELENGFPKKRDFCPMDFWVFDQKWLCFLAFLKIFFSNAGQTLPRDYTPPKKKHFRKKNFGKNFEKKIFKNFSKKIKKFFSIDFFNFWFRGFFTHIENILFD